MPSIVNKNPKACIDEIVGPGEGESIKGKTGVGFGVGVISTYSNGLSIQTSGLNSLG